MDEIAGLGANCPLLKLEVLDGAANKVEGDKPDDKGSNFPLSLPSFCEFSVLKSSDEAQARPKAELDKLQKSLKKKKLENCLQVVLEKDA